MPFLSSECTACSIALLLKSVSTFGTMLWDHSFTAWFLVLMGQFCKAARNARSTPSCCSRPSASPGSGHGLATAASSCLPRNLLSSNLSMSTQWKFWAVAGSQSLLSRLGSGSCPGSTPFGTGSGARSGCQGPPPPPPCTDAATHPYICCFKTKFKYISPDTLDVYTIRITILGVFLFVFFFMSSTFLPHLMLWNYFWNIHVHWYLIMQLLPSMPWWWVHSLYRLLLLLPCLLPPYCKSKFSHSSSLRRFL